MQRSDGGFRLVTAFNSVTSYAKPIPSRSTTTEDVFRFLARFRYIIKTNMTKQFFLLPKTNNSLKFLSTLTPFKEFIPSGHGDARVHRVLGDMFHAGMAVKIDELYTGGNSVHELLSNWEALLTRLHENNLICQKDSNLSPANHYSWLVMVRGKH